MLFNLFALTNEPAQRIVRFQLSQEVQDELTTYIQIQEASFEEKIGSEIEFDGKYKPDDDEVLFIEGYDDIDNLEVAIRNPLGVETVEPTIDVFNTIKSLFTGYEDKNKAIKILIQHFDKRKIISTKGLSIFHASDVYKKVEGIGLTIDSKLTAILHDGKLKFHSFFLMRQIFDLSQYYIVATNEDIAEFVSIDKIKVDNLDALYELSDSWVRRKIALVQQSEILNNVPMNEMKAVAVEFNVPFETVIDDGVEMIKLPNDKAGLKNLLRFLDEDYYKSPLSKTNFVTNSKREL